MSRRSERNLHDEGREEDAGDEHALHQASETVHPEDECGNQGQGDPLILHRCSVKRLLRRYGYPPDKQAKATETVIEQAELLCRDWAA